MAVRCSTDLTVVGGGLAGVCAAVAAAREGLQVALVGNRPVLGGNASSEIRVWTRGATGGGSRYGEEMGILGELKMENLYKNPDSNPYLWDAIILDFVAREKNIKLFLNTHVHSVDMAAPNTIAGLRAFQIGSELELAFDSPFFVDATGDGTVGFLAGAHYRMGRESRAEFGEAFAPLVADGASQGSTIFFHTKRLLQPVKYVAPGFAYSRDYVADLLNRGSRIVGPDMQGCDYWWFEFGGELDTIKDSETIAWELRRLVFGIWDYIKNSGEFPEAAYLTLDWIGSIPGKRGSRRLLGEHVLTQNDIMSQRQFSDAVCYGGWYLDYHPPGGIYSKEEPCEQIPVGLYHIPLRCLYSRNVHNLFMAGRDISTTYAAFASTRVMNTCALTGQAVGTATAVCLEKSKAPRELAQDEIEEIQQRLLLSDHYIPGVRNETADLALTAVVDGSSAKEFANVTAELTVSLEKPCFLVLPVMGNLCQVRLLVDCEAETELEYEIMLGDRREDYRPVKTVKHAVVPVSPGAKQWIDLKAGVTTENQSVFLRLGPDPRIRLWCSGEDLCPGVFLTPDFASRLVHYPCFQVDPGYPMYSPDNLRNGYNRPYGLPNMWVSRPMQQGTPEWVTLSFAEVSSVKEIRLYFDPNLDREIPSLRPERWAPFHRIYPQVKVPKELVKSYGIFAWVEGKWEQLAHAEENFQRLNVHRFSPVQTDRIRIEFYRTHGARCVRLFEVRVY
jgi:hypothetical protein